MSASASRTQDPAPSPLPADAPVGQRLIQALQELKPGWLLAGAAFIVLAGFSGHRFWHQSKAPHFVYQAMAFLEGHLELTVPPPNIEDWARIGDKWYVSFPAFPALLLMPLVALFGYQFNDTSFTVVIAVLNLVAFFAVLQAFSKAGDSPRTEQENLILTALLCFGTLYFYCSIRGEVWFTAEVMGVGLTALYVLFAHRARHPLLAGLFFSAGTLTRTPIMFSGVFFLCELFLPNGQLADLQHWNDAAHQKERWTKLSQFALGALPLAAWHMWINQARFGSITDFGHDHFFNNRVNADIARYGLFNLHYLSRNLDAAFFLLPWKTNPDFHFAWDPHGMSLLITTPLFLLAFFPLAQKAAARSGNSKISAPASTRPRLFLALALTVAAMALPGLLYQNDGYIQFGFRFSVDWTPYMILLLAIGARKMDRLWWSLAGVGIAVNTWGALAFRGYTEMFR